RAARVTEAAATHLPERNAAGSDYGTDGDRDLVAHSTRRVLVDYSAPEPGCEIDRLAARHHRVGQGKGLRRGQTAEPDRHEEGRGLIVGHVPAHVAGDELPDLGSGELFPVPLSL